MLQSEGVEKVQRRAHHSVAAGGQNLEQHQVVLRVVRGFLGTPIFFSFSLALSSAFVSVSPFVTRSLQLTPTTWQKWFRFPACPKYAKINRETELLRNVEKPAANLCERDTHTTFFVSQRSKI